MRPSRSSRATTLSLRSMPKSPVLDDHLRAFVLVHDLKAVALRHREGGKHGTVRRIEDGLQLGLGAALDQVEIEVAA